MSEKTIRMYSRREVLATGVAAAGVAGIPAARAQVSKKGVKVTIVTGSPHKRGASFLLADRFIEGAQEVGADIVRFDAAFKRITACSGCDHCGLGSSPCVYRDDMFEINDRLIDSDLIVFCTPLYYFGFSAQLKLFIDRFYAINNQLHRPKNAALLAAAWNTNDWTMTALKVHYETIVRYMGWTDVGQVMGIGCGTRSQCQSSEFPDMAYELGRKICAA